MNTAIDSRDTSGRFQKGHGGRPKGSANKRRAFSAYEFSASIADEADKKLEALIQKAASVVEDELSRGNLRAATWALDRVRPSSQSKLSAIVTDADLTSIEGIVTTAQTVGEMVAEGRLGLDEAGRFITILTNCAHLRGFLEMGELRTMLEEVKKQGTGRTINPAVPYPLWGNLSNRAIS